MAVSKVVASAWSWPREYLPNLNMQALWMRRYRQAQRVLLRRSAPLDQRRRHLQFRPSPGIDELRRAVVAHRQEWPTWSALWPGSSNRPQQVSQPKTSQQDSVSLKALKYRHAVLDHRNQFLDPRLQDRRVIPGPVLDVD